MTNKIINNGWYAVQIGDEKDFDRGSKSYNEALKIANDFANNSDYDGQEIRILTCNIYEDGMLNKCTNEEIVRERVISKDFIDGYKCARDCIIAEIIGLQYGIAVVKGSEEYKAYQNVIDLIVDIYGEEYEEVRIRYGEEN